MINLFFRTNVFLFKLFLFIEVISLVYILSIVPLSVGSENRHGLCRRVDSQGCPVCQDCQCSGQASPGREQSTIDRLGPRRKCRLALFVHSAHVTGYVADGFDFDRGAERAQQQLAGIITPCYGRKAEAHECTATRSKERADSAIHNNNKIRDSNLKE